MISKENQSRDISNENQEEIQTPVSLKSKKILDNYAIVAGNTCTITISINTIISLYYLSLSGLGQGKFGDVYKARDLKTSELVALKIVYRERLSVERMRNEKLILESLVHPHIVRYIDYYEDTKRFYLVEELVDGGDLIDVLKVKVKYNEVEARKLVLSLVQAVQYLHAKRIVHRDIKCDNALCKVDLQGNISLKLTDFGHACECNGIELTYFRVGTDGYRSPELIEKKKYGKPVDMFSVGVVSYMILLGTFPFHPKLNNFEQKVLNCEHICTSGKENLAGLWSAISKNARSFLLKLLEYHHIKRLTADEALREDWINENDSCLTVNDLTDAIGEIRQLNARRKLIASIRKVMAFNVNIFRKRKNEQIEKDKIQETEVDVQSNEEINVQSNEDIKDNESNTKTKKQRIE